MADRRPDATPASARVAPARLWGRPTLDGFEHDDVENRAAASQARGASASPSSAASASASSSSARSPPSAHKLAPLSHHTPVTRFLSKQSLGFIPKLQPPAATGSVSPTSPSFRLPSLAHAPPLSPQKWASSSSRAGESPPRVGSCGSLSEQFASMSTAPAMPSLKEALERQALRSASASAATSTAASSTGMLTIQDICRPFPYQRSASCPSDATMTDRALEFGDARHAPASPSPSLPPPRRDVGALTMRDITQSRLERSSSADGLAPRPGAVRSPAEAIDLYQWCVSMRRVPCIIAKVANVDTYVRHL